MIVVSAVLLTFFKLSALLAWVSPIHIICGGIGIKKGTCGIFYGITSGLCVFTALWWYGVAFGYTDMPLWIQIPAFCGIIFMWIELFIPTRYLH